MNDRELRRCFAMFAMLGWCMNGDFHESEIPAKAWKLADAMMNTEDDDSYDTKEELGIAAVKPKRTYVRKAYNR